ncbi:MAG: hypothetical protein ACKOW9_00690 [Candidatus Paceibacterota bacterium]
MRSRLFFVSTVSVFALLAAPASSGWAASSNLSAAKKAAAALNKFASTNPSYTKDNLESFVKSSSSTQALKAAVVNLPDISGFLGYELGSPTTHCILLPGVYKKFTVKNGTCQGWVERNGSLIRVATELSIADSIMSAAYRNAQAVLAFEGKDISKVSIALLVESLKEAGHAPFSISFSKSTITLNGKYAKATYRLTSKGVRRV